MSKYNDHQHSLKLSPTNANSCKPYLRYMWQAVACALSESKRFGLDGLLHAVTKMHSWLDNNYRFAFRFFSSPSRPIEPSRYGKCDQTKKDMFQDLGSFFCDVKTADKSSHVANTIEETGGQLRTQIGITCSLTRISCLRRRKLDKAGGWVG